MQIVIDIPDNYDLSKIQNGSIASKMILKAVANGTPLPKGHGRLIDISDIEWAKYQEEKNYIDYEVIDWDDIVNANTIIEADKAESEVNNG